MRGVNQVWLSGNVGGKIVTGVTRDGNPCCSFSVAAEDGQRSATWVRANVYGPLAVKVQNRLQKGMYVSIVGELMNRDGKFGELTEVRAKDVVFFAQEKSEDRRMHSVCINGIVQDIDRDEVSYEYIVELASSGSSVLHSVVYSRGSGAKPSGTLTPGESVEVRDGMIFSAVITGNA